MIEISIFDKNRFASKKQEYETPDVLFEILNDIYNFDIDVCADENNHKCEKYYSEQEDALTKEWNGVCWMNPPYINLKTWIEKAYKESRKDNCTVVCLIPARTNTSWWHKYCMKGEITFIEGRPKFKGCKYGLPQPLAIVVFSNKISNTYKSLVYKE